ncbi:hypothetical protein [Novipirellula artificiosorum]|uniref:hypothetical protein n=1 Tax=Novipirellula artificiosorum TaxID=2528016 RepID=UPI0011B4AA4D|nr:hypothetical protein [Novipirellula artificiosorum]
MQLLLQYRCFWVLSLFSILTPEQDQVLSQQDERRIELLFQQGTEDRSKAYELKSKWDRLEVFDEHEDRCLDLFHQS